MLHPASGEGAAKEDTAVDAPYGVSDVGPVQCNHTWPLLHMLPNPKAGQ